MKIKVRSEAKKPTKISSELLDRAISSIEINSDNREWYQRYVDHHKIRLAFDLDYVRDYLPKGASLLELGAMPPILNAAISNLEYKCQGVDIAPERFQSAISSLGLNIVKANIETENLPLDSNSFDGALFNELFEHLRINLIHTMGEVFRVLKPGGTLLLSTPNLTSYIGWMNLIFENKARGTIYNEYLKLQKLGHMGHVRLYTSVEVCTFLKAIGFEIQEVIYRGQTTPNSFLKKAGMSLLLSVVPRLRPFYSIVAKKPV